MEHIHLPAVEAVTILTVVDNYIDVFMPDQGPATRLRDLDHDRFRATRVLEGGQVGEIPIAEHGFSALVTVRFQSRETSLLFDAGRTPEGLSHNMAALGLDAGAIEAIVLSHGHFDHTTGLDGLARRCGRTNLPVVIHPEFWNRRRITLPGRDAWELPSTSRSGLEGIGFSIIEQQQPSFLLHGAALVTGEIDRSNDFEPGFPYQDAWREGHWQPDPLVLDDQALVVNVRDRGLIVLSGCGHAGIVNTVRYAQRLTGVERVHAIIGGFHLNGPLYEALIPQTCAALAQIAPDVIVPGHCTGWRAMHRFAAEFPQAFVPSSVGTRLEFCAPDTTRST
jgi:7,8-dihydropterin-6-yl-methyl-4-(beta-D-ribofuranosyl)aminobenzene 5'-phosphate synthase